MNVENDQKLSRLIWGLLPWVFVCLTFACILFLYSKVENKKERLLAEMANAAKAVSPPINVVTQKILPIEMTDKIDLPAVIKAWEDLTIRAEIAGTVVKVDVKEGDRVAKGQALLEIDTRDYANTLHSIKARQELANTNFFRLQKLDRKDAISQAGLDEAEAVFKELNALYAMAQLNLERCTIRAPFAGIINDLPAISGKFLDRGDPVAQLLAIDRLKVEVAIPEADIAAARNVDRCKIVLAALDNREVIGKTIFVASKPASPAMVYILRLVIDNPAHEILPGMFARAIVVKSTDEKSIGIPLYAIITQDSQQFVFKVENGIATKQKVATGFWEDWKVQITSGLTEGDQVVIVGHRGLEQGQSVNIVKTVTRPEAVTR